MKNKEIHTNRKAKGQEEPTLIKRYLPARPLSINDHPSLTPSLRFGVQRVLRMAKKGGDVTKISN